MMILKSGAWQKAKCTRWVSVIDRCKRKSESGRLDQLTSLWDTLSMNFSSELSAEFQTAVVWAHHICGELQLFIFFKYQIQGRFPLSYACLFLRLSCLRRTLEEKPTESTYCLYRFSNMFLKQVRRVLCSSHQFWRIFSWARIRPLSCSTVVLCMEIRRLQSG